MVDTKTHGQPLFGLVAVDWCGTILLVTCSNFGRFTKSDFAILKHLKLNTECIRDDLRTVFRVLAQARSDSHLSILEALYIQRLTPTLCSQKEHVRVLSLF